MAQSSKDVFITKWGRVFKAFWAPELLVLCDVFHTPLVGKACYACTTSHSESLVRKIFSICSFKAHPSEVYEGLCYNTYSFPIVWWLAINIIKTIQCSCPGYTKYRISNYSLFILGLGETLGRCWLFHIGTCGLTCFWKFGIRRCNSSVEGASPWVILLFQRSQYVVM
jgi:hypothetical protein